MSQLAEARCVRRSPRYLTQRQPAQEWPGRPANLRSVAEGMLRDLAFVYQATRSVRESMMEDAEGPRSTRC